jgi:uncharacterized protein (UPF0305 family)
MASEEMIQAINKHLMGNAQDFEKFIELTKRFENFNACSRAGAAALGYLIAKDELEAAKEEEEEPDVYDEVVAIINRFDNQRVNSLSPHSATDQIFTLIYEWLDGELAKPGSVAFPGHTRNKIDELFSLFVIEKPKA